MQVCFDRLDARALGGLAAGLALFGSGPAPRGPPRFRPAQESRDFVERTLRGREPDPLDAPAKAGPRGVSRLGGPYCLRAQRFEALERQGEVRAALAGDQRVNLVDDHRVHVDQAFPGLRREQQKQRFWRRDENVGRLPQELRSLGRGRVAGPGRNLRRRHRNARGVRRIGDARQGRAQVAFDVCGERLQGRDVEDPAPLLRRRGRLEHQSIEAPEEGGECLAAAGRRQDQRGIAARDRRPPQLLRFRRLPECAGEPRADGRLEQIERPGDRHNLILDPIIRDMGDAGEGLVDAESRLAERMEEREEEKRKARQGGKGGDPELARQLESCRLARTEMRRQLELTTHDGRKKQIGQAIAELDRRITQLSK
jgi:hypothetical protein